MAQHMIFYFTGTGNSLKSALTIARKLQGSTNDTARVVCMGPDEPFSFTGCCDTIGFVFPCHFGGVPWRVLEYVRALDLTGQESAYRYAVVTYGGGFAATSLGQLNAVLTEKGFPLDYGAMAQAFSTYVVLYKMSTKLNEKTTLLKTRLEQVIADILKRHSLPPKCMNAVAGMYNRFATSNGVKNEDCHFAAGDACVSCGQCARVCPVGNITLEGDPPRPRWHHRCTQCLACLQLCPREAIDFGAKTRGRGRYKHPEVTVPMLIAYNHNHTEPLGY